MLILIGIPFSFHVREVKCKKQRNDRLTVYSISIAGFSGTTEMDCGRERERRAVKQGASELHTAWAAYPNVHQVGASVEDED